MEQQSNPIRPSHYGSGPYECIKVIQAWELSFELGNAIKYINRAGKKSPDKITDLRKAIQYLEFEIEKAKDDKRSKESS